MNLIIYVGTTVWMNMTLPPFTTVMSVPFADALQPAPQPSPPHGRLDWNGDTHADYNSGSNDWEGAYYYIPFQNDTFNTTAWF